MKSREQKAESRNAALILSAFCFLLSALARGATIDRIAAVIERQVMKSRKQKSEGRNAALILSAFCFLLSALARGATIDRIAAVIERQVITVSEVTQMVELRFFPRTAGQSEDDYRHDVLEALIAQALRYRDVERFGAQDISKDNIETRLRDIQARFASPADFTAALQRTELTLDEVRALIKRQLQVEAYIQERFAPLIFVSSDEIEAEYNGRWSAQRRQRGLPIPPLTEVSDEIRTLLRADRLQSEVAKWTTQLRAHANVDIYAWR